jgi:hypothetical protein
LNYKEQVDNHINIRVKKKKQARVVLKYGMVFLILFLILFLFNLLFDIHKEYISVVHIYKAMLVLFILSVFTLYLSYTLSEKVYKLQEEHLRIEKNSVLK